MLSIALAISLFIAEPVTKPVIVEYQGKRYRAILIKEIGKVKAPKLPQKSVSPNSTFRSDYLLDEYYSRPRKPTDKRRGETTDEWIDRIGIDEWERINYPIIPAG